MAEKESSVLLCYDGDCDCPVCGYLDGDESIETLLKVIEVLDKKLAEAEKSEQILLKSTIGAVKMLKTKDNKAGGITKNVKVSTNTVDLITGISKVAIDHNLGKSAVEALAEVIRDTIEVKLI